MSRVSLIIPTKDRPLLLLRSVLSALTNCGETDEIIVIDDHSVIPAEKSLQHHTDPRLRIERLPHRSHGASAARNLGIEISGADVIAFLDDDDELLPDYIDYIRNLASQKADYGFSSFLMATEGGLISASKKRFSEGPIDQNSPFRKRTFGFGMGVWMTRGTAEHVGPLDTTMTINEDTDYVCRLSRAGLKGWYSAKAGVIVHDHFGSLDGQKGNMTRHVDASERARCMKVLCISYPEYIQHLGKGYIRHCLRTGSLDDAMSFIQTQPNAITKLRFYGYLQLKILGYRLTKKTFMAT